MRVREKRLSNWDVRLGIVVVERVLRLLRVKSRRIGWFLCFSWRSDRFEDGNLHGGPSWCCCLLGRRQYCSV